MNPRNLLILLFSINVVNYLDRQVLSGVFPLLQTQFHLSDTALGALGSAFMITFVITMLPFGAWSDKWRPNKIAGIGVFFWSIATLLSSAAWSYASLFGARALVGIGESAYAPTGNTLLSRAYPEKQRSLVLSLFNMGLPVGGAIGVVLGGLIGSHWGWRPAFLVSGLPGMVLGWLIWRMREIRTRDGQTLDTAVHQATHTARPNLSTVIPLLWNKAYVYTCLAYAAISFVLGAFILFVPLYFERVFGDTLTHATTTAGLIQVVAGLTGAPVGGLVADFVRRRVHGGRAYTLVFAMVMCAVCMEFGVRQHSVWLLFFCAFFLLWQTGAAAAVLLDAVNPLVWNTASAFSIFAMHLLGDVWSPVAVGAVSDRFGLQTAFSLLPIPILLAALLFWLAGRNANLNGLTTL